MRFPRLLLLLVAVLALVGSSVGAVFASTSSQQSAGDENGAESDAERQGRAPAKHLRLLHPFMGAMPNAVDVQVRVVGDDDELHDFVVTPGTVDSVDSDDGTVVVERRDGPRALQVVEAALEAVPDPTV